MKIAVVNKYLYPRGGADVAALQMARLLNERGHRVILMGMAPPKGAELEFAAYLTPPVDYDAPMGAGKRLALAAGLVYSVEARRRMDELIRRERPDLVHFHNIYHQLSPSVIDAAAAHRLPMVMTLHDYKVTCPVYSHLCHGRVCEACRGGRFYNAVRFRCTKGSLSKSLLNMAEMYLHRTILKTYEKVHVFVSPSLFLKRKVTELGFRGRIVHAPNFVDVRAVRPRYDWDERQIAYFGRLSPEKGLRTLMDAVKGLGLRLRVIGTGPIQDELKRRADAEGMDNVRFDGFLAGEELRRAVAAAMFTVLPSEWYENNPQSVIESFALGKPVIGSDMGGIPELVAEGRGLCFRAGDAGQLRARIEELASDPDAVRAMGRNARQYAETHLSHERFYRRLTEVYGECMNLAAAQERPA
jgi:glycosyltransferase involved in cell wall biosynthesis